MEKVRFYTKWNRPPRAGEKNNGESIVETAGYIPPKVQIENMILAGRRLADYRAEAYDFQVGQKETKGDPTRSPGFDLADASELARAAMERLEEAKTEVELARQKLAKVKAEQEEADKKELARLKAEEAKKVSAGQA